MPEPATSLRARQEYLAQLKARTAAQVEQIRLLKEQVEGLKWQIPESQAQEQIMQLRQSVRNPSVFRTQDGMATYDSICGVQSKAADREMQARLIKLGEARKEMLLKIDRLKTEGNLYQAHRRIILKEYLEDLRDRNSRLVKINTQTQQDHAWDMESVRIDYQKLQTALQKSELEMPGC